MNPGVTLDAGPLVALDRADRRVIVLLAQADQTVAPVIVQARRSPRRSGTRHGRARLARLLRQPRTQVAPLGRMDATDVGRLLAASGTSDIADAHVVICARRTGTGVVTSDPRRPAHARLRTGTHRHMNGGH